MTAGAWGAFPNEPLNNVESGTGKIRNLLFLPHIQKYVQRSPIISSNHPELSGKMTFAYMNGIIASLTKLTIAPGLKAVLELIAALAGMKVPALVGSTAALFAAIGVGIFYAVR